MTASFQGYNRKLATSSWDSNVTESPSLRLQFLLLFILLLHGIYLPKVIHPLHLLYCRTEIFLKQLHLLNFSNKNILKGIIIFICFFPKTLFAQWWNSISIVEDYFFISNTNIALGLFKRKLCNNSQKIHLYLWCSFPTHGLTNGFAHCLQTYWKN